MALVIHYKAGPYLPITENWLYNQLINVPAFEAEVYCQGTQNLDVFPISRLRSFGAGRMTSGRGFLNKLLNETGRNPFLARLLRRDRPDVVHAHFGPSGYFVSGFRRERGFALVTSFYGYDISVLPREKPRWRRRYRRLFERGDVFLVEGPHMREKLIELGCPAEKVFVQRLGIPLDEVRYEARRRPEGGEVTVLLAGSFREKKGFPDALEAVGLALGLRPGIELSVTVIGDSDGSKAGEKEKQRILGKIEQYGLQERVRMLGYQPRAAFVEQLYLHDVFLSPSVTAASGDNEGGAPVSIIEAAASGMPVLATNHCDIPGIVIDGTTGYLVPERDPKSLAERLVSLASDPSARVEMGAQGRKIVEQRFDARVQGVALGAVYRSLIAASRGRREPAHVEVAEYPL